MSHSQAIIKKNKPNNLTHALLHRTRVKQSSLLLQCRANFSKGLHPPACLSIFYNAIFFFQNILNLFLFVASSFLLSALAASKRHTMHSPPTPNCNRFSPAGCIGCYLVDTALAPRCTEYKECAGSYLTPVLSQAWVIPRTDIPPPRWAPMCCTQLTGAIHGLLQQPNLTQGDMEQERGCSLAFLLRIFQTVTLFLLLSPTTQPTDVA